MDKDTNSSEMGIPPSLENLPDCLASLLRVNNALSSLPFPFCWTPVKPAGKVADCCRSVTCRITCLKINNKSN